MTSILNPSEFQLRQIILKEVVKRETVAEVQRMGEIGTQTPHKLNYSNRVSY